VPATQVSADEFAHLLSVASVSLRSLRKSADVSRRERRDTEGPEKKTRREPRFQILSKETRFTMISSKEHEEEFVLFASGERFEKVSDPTILQFFFVFLRVFVTSW
jgi:hypothetical protein